MKKDKGSNALDLAVAALLTQVNGQDVDPESAGKMIEFGGIKAAQYLGKIIRTFDLGSALSLAPIPVVQGFGKETHIHEHHGINERSQSEVNDQRLSTNHPADQKSKEPR